MTTSEEALKLLTPDALREWLESKPADEPVGYESLSGSCPIALFLKEKGILVNVGNGWDLSTFGVVGDHVLIAPTWVQTFAEIVDSGEDSEPFPISLEDAEGLFLGRSDTEECEHGDDFALQDDKCGWYRYTLYRPVAGKLAKSVA